MLEGCTTYKIDVPNGHYQVQLYFVEPQIKPTENIYNLSNSDTQTESKNQRIFDVYVNGVLVEKQFNLAQTYPEKYGVTLTTQIQIDTNKGITLSLKPIEGQPVMSGVLIEKLD